LRFGTSLTQLAAALAIGCGACSAASAQQAGNPLDNPLKSVMKLMGFATDSPQPQDFVVKARPQTEPDYIPVFQPPPEPARPVLETKQLDALRGDLDSVEKRAAAARAAFPPAAAAGAQAKSQAVKAKSAPRTSDQ